MDRLIAKFEAQGNVSTGEIGGRGGKELQTPLLQWSYASKRVAGE